MNATHALSTYWQGVAQHNCLTMGECDALAELLSREPDAGDDGESSRAIIARALSVELDGARASRDALDNELSARIDPTGALSVGHGSLNDGTATVTLNASAKGYMLKCISTGHRVGYFINGEPYPTPDAIPAAMRKARVLAFAFQHAHDDGAMLASIEAYVSADELYRRWGIFARS